MIEGWPRSTSRARLVASNLLGPLRMMRAALPHLDGGFVVNLSAVVAEQPPAGMVAYAATKAGLTAADTALRREVPPTTRPRPICSPSASRSTRDGLDAAQPPGVGDRHQVLQESDRKAVAGPS